MSHDTPQDDAHLRRLAEVRLKEKHTGRKAELSGHLTPEDAAQLIHELEVHQIELEIQNEELRCSQGIIETAKARYFDLYDLAPLGYVTLDTSGQIQEANLTAATLLREERGTLLKNPFTRYIFNEDQDIYYLYRKELLEPGQGAKMCELRLVTSDHQILWARLAATAVKDLDNEPACRVILSDINELRQAEEMLREKEKHINSIFRGAPIGIGLVADRHLITVNGRMCEMTGYKEHELIGQSARMLYPNDEEFEFVGREKYARIGDLGTGEVETRWQKKNNTIIDVLLSSTPLDQDDWSKGVTFAALDITERKLTEKSLKQKTEEIEQFAYIVSHDLKGPLVTVTTFLDLLQQDIFNNNQDEIDSAISYIADAATQMDQMLEALLQYSRAGRVQVLSKTVFVNALAESCLKTLAGAIHQHQVEVVISAAPLQLRGDVLRLGLVWQNLIENAIKYRGNQPHLRIEIGVETQDKETIFYIRDNGMGIEKKHAERIFKLFSQLNPQCEGSGLGLALVKKIVELYNGRIWVESDGLERGSCFRFTLPGAILAEDTAI